MSRFKGHARGGKLHPTRLLTYTEKDFINLLGKNERDLIMDLSRDLKIFQHSLETSKICEKKCDLIVSLLLKVSHALPKEDDVRLKAVTILGEVFSERCPIFYRALKMHVGIGIIRKESQTIEDNLNSVCDLFQALLVAMPCHLSSVLPVDELCTTVKAAFNHENSLSVKLKDLVELRDAVKDQQRVKIVESTCALSMSTKSWDNSEYRDIQILPQWKEINHPKPPYKLRPNIVDGRYDDWEHYFDVQFRLLREDFISPLRKGISDYIEGRVGRDLRNIKVYKDVRVTKQLFTQSGLCHEIKFDNSRLKGVKWEHSKLLIFGSLLCLSSDNFHNKVYFATVTNREPSKISRGVLEVMFQGGTDLMIREGQNTNFIMVESMAYFEASQHILRSLQAAEIHMPFTKYLIDNDCAVIDLPQYLSKRGSNSSKYDIQFIINTPRLDRQFTSVAVTDNSQWPKYSKTKLDRSQLDAIKMALTQEIAVIQGPPGTGKTYIGLKIVQALLKNQKVWNPGLARRNPLLRNRSSPILIMCLTNHAVDQFLEGILELHKKLNLIRIGGRSKNEKIQEYSLYKVKQKLRNVPKSRYAEMKALSKERDSIGARCKVNMEAQKNSERAFIKLSEIENVMDECHHRSLLDPAETEEEQQKALELWLGLYEKEVIEEYIPVMEDGSEYETSDDSSLDDLSDNDEYFEDEVVMDDGTINIPGEASLEEEARLIDDVSEMFKELKFEDHDQEVRSKKKERVFNVRRLVKINQVRKMRKIRDWGMNRRDMESREVEKIDDIYSLELPRRWKLYKFWHSKYRTHLLVQLEESCREYNTKCEEIIRAKKENDRYALETADVIGMTTTGAAKYQHVLHVIKPKIVIVEEAAEVLESHIVSALNPGTQHLILIGDHKQLRPKPNEYDLAVKYNLDISLFERLVKNNFPHATLQIQHRMRPEISELVRGHIYDTLMDHESVQHYPKVKGICTNIFLIQHCEPERGSDDLSHSNDFEATYVVALCKYLLQQGYNPSQITVLVTYTGQLLTLKNRMSKDTFEGVAIKTVDNFQGEENDITILSLVRSNKQGSIGFLREENRVCVALSRAKHGFYCIGNFQLLRGKADIWERIVSDMTDKGKVGKGLKIHCNNHPKYQFEIVEPEDFARHFPNGGCTQDCEYRLECGHQCTFKCHSNNPEHLDYKCKKICNRECREGHRCTNPCYKECLCMELIERILPSCGHYQMMFCHENPGNVVCRNKCPKRCQEGHECSLLCSDPCCCYTKVLKTITKCGHSQEMYCHKTPEKVDCLGKCKQECPKGHPCPRLCHQKCLPCVIKEEVIFPKCGHRGEKNCHQYLGHVKCRTKCEKKCKNGHPCWKKCYEDCQDCTTLVESTLECGHIAKMMCCDDPRERICAISVKRTLDCGHIARMKCCDDPREHICAMSVKRTLECGHIATMKCCDDPKQHICTTPVKKTLRCNHIARMKCSDNPRRHVCEEPTLKKLKCGHECLSSCGINSSRLICHELVAISLKCGHSADIECKDNHLSFISKFKECKSSRQDHKCTRSCWENGNRTACQVIVERNCSQGHKHHRPCYQQFDHYPCTKNCKKKLTCGHQCKKLCSEICETRCAVSIKKTYPCGHQHMVPCSSTVEDIPCDMICRYPLACGHFCRGKCSNCRSSHIHKPCEYSVRQKHFCGEEVRMKCLGVQNVHNNPSTRILHCPHRKVPYDCNKQVVECQEECQWNCQHHQCTKVCHEQCDRPRCDKRCNLQLECGHKCVGLCGEPCISVCPECDKDAFLKQLKLSDHPVGTFIQLPCGHIFPIRRMDDYVDSHPRSKVTPLQCPECSSPLNCSYRYGNSMKTSLLHVDAVRRKIDKLSTESQQLDAKRSQLAAAIRDLRPKLRGDILFSRNVVECVRHLSLGIYNAFGAEDMLLIFYFTRVLQFALITTQSPRHVFEPVLQWLVSAIETKRARFSFQILHDLKSEFYRLCIYAKSLIYRHDYQHAFLERYNSDPNLRVTRENFLFHSKSLDRKCRVRNITSSLSSTEDLDHQIESFQLPILNGCWEACQDNHYYCIPVSEANALSVQCSECTGVAIGNIQIKERNIPELPKFKVDLAQQREAVLASLPERIKSPQAVGKSSKKNRKRRKKK